MKIYCLNNSLLESKKANNIARIGMIEGFASLEEIEDVEAYFLTKNLEKTMPNGNWKENISLKTIYLPSYSSANDSYNKIKRMLVHNRIIDIYFLLVSLFKAGQEDIIYIRGFKSSISVYLSSILLDRKYIFELHNYEFGSNKFKDFICRRILNSSNLNVTVSEFTAINWRKNRVNNKILVEPSGVDLEKFQTDNSKEESRAKLGLSKECFLAVYTGKLSEEKGINILINAAEQLEKDSIKIIVVGGENNSIKKFKKQKRHKNLKNIVFEGHHKHSQIVEYHNAADVLLVPNSRSCQHSIQYTSPIKLSEYIASKKLIICSELPSIVRRISEEKCFFFNPDYPSQLSNLLSKINSSSEVMQGKNICDDHVERLAWSSRCKRIIKSSK